jgi:heme-degrading monooxygenase HmoA
MHIIIWEFKVQPQHLDPFSSAYDSDGDWARLFHQAEGYRGTQLLRSSEEPNRFLTIDVWDSEPCFQLFQERFGPQYRELDSRLEGFTVCEKKVGSFSGNWFWR